jgi:hypothetical protein
MKKITLGLYFLFAFFLLLISSDLNFTDFLELENFTAPFSIIKPYEIYLLVINCIVALLFYLTILKIKKLKGDKTFSFIEFFMIVFGIYYGILGFINCVLARYYSNLNMGVDSVLEYDLLCLVVIFISYLMFYVLFPKKYSKPENLYVIDFIKFRRSIIILCSISIIGILSFWIFYGAIPVFSGHGVLNMNMDLEEKIPIFIQYGSNLMPVYALYSGVVYLINNKKDYFILSLIMFLFILLVLSGIRFPIITAFILAIILVFPLIKSEKKYFFQISFILLLFFVSLGVWRNRDTDLSGGIVHISAIGSVFGQLGMEFSEFARLTGVLDNPEYHPTENSAKEVFIDNIIITSVPNVIWNLVGIDKKDYQKMTYITFGTLVYGSNITGIRPGVFGEVYYGFGKTGLVMWSILLTLFICILDNKRMKYQEYSYLSFHNLIVTLWGVILVLTVIGHFKGTTHYFTTTFAIFYSIIFMAKKTLITESQSQI